MKFKRLNNCSVFIHLLKLLTSGSTNQLQNIKTFFAIGATINFETGEVKRAPKWMSEIGLEWFYRLLSEPDRLWKRYLIDDLPFFWLILKQKFRFYKNPWL